MLASFTEVDITPPAGTRKIGWLKDIVGDHVIDPLFARVCVLQSGGADVQRVAFVQLDTLSVGRKQVAEVRKRVGEKYKFPGANVMVSATHNHAGPAVVRAGEVKADPQYVEALTQKIVAAFGHALDRMEEAEVAVGRRANHELANNRRVVMRDGVVRTHGTFDDPDAIYLEGPVDPEVYVVAVRAKAGTSGAAVPGPWLGCLVNYALHPAHHGAGTGFSAGWPGVLANELKKMGFPVPMFLNGALGQIATNDPRRGGADRDMNQIATGLAAEVEKALADAPLRGGDGVKLSSRSEMLELPFREASENEIKGKIRGAQRFIDSAIYDRMMPELLEEFKTQGKQLAEVQVISLDEFDFVSVPCELFVELGLAIKEQANPRRAVIVGLANGMVGYVPTKQAFQRGGYETTLLNTSKLGHDAGDMLVDAAVRLIRAGA
jgi:hypothetical protein